MFVFSSPSKLHAICIGFFYILLNIQVFAQCDNYIGTIGNADTIYLCPGASLLLEVDSVALLDNQELYYIFGKIYNFGIFIPWVEINQTGFFENDDVPSGEIIAQAFIVETDEFGNVNSEDPCFAGSNMISIVNLNQIQIESWEECRSIKGFSFSISGGLPEFDKDGFYEVSGSHFNGKVKAKDTITIEIGDYNYLNNSNYYTFKYEIQANDENECNADYINEFTCMHLPVIFDVSFEGQQTQSGNLLTWKSRHQTFINSFKIEVSKNNGIDWFEVYTIKAEGTPSEIVEYEFLDENLSDELCYYRLLQTDIDETAVVIDVLQIIPKNYIQIYPNPTGNLLNAVYNSTMPVQFLIYDTAGKVVFSTNEESHQTHSIKQMDITHLPNNIYYLVIISEDFTASQKFVVQR